MNMEVVMPIPVKLAEVVSEMQFQTEECHAFLNRENGKIAIVDEVYCDDEELAECLGVELPEGVSLAEFLFESKEWIVLPSKFDIHEWDMMRRFSDTQEAEVRAELLGAIHGRGAFRMFKDVLHHLGLQDEWYAYRDSEFERLAMECLEEHGIPFER